MKKYTELKRKAFEVLKSKLPEELFYHDLQHTLDVISVCNEYIDRYKINSHQAELLRIAALLHDIGFTVTYKNHEEKGAEIAEEMMAKSGFSKNEIEVVKGLIMATKIPQNPKNKLEQIICDADLDYLGRKDFEIISERLFHELKSLSLIQDKESWNRIQVKFLETHSYHTEFAKKNRQPKKYKRLLQLKDLTTINN